MNIGGKDMQCGLVQTQRTNYGARTSAMEQPIENFLFRIREEPVLGLTGKELTFSIVALIVLCFAFLARIALITHGYVDENVQYFSCVLLLSTLFGCIYLSDLAHSKSLF